MTPRLAHIANRDESGVLVDAIAARSRRLQSIFSGSFTTDAAAATVGDLAREIEEACRALRRRAAKAAPRAA